MPRPTSRQPGRTVGHHELHVRRHGLGPTRIAPTVPATTHPDRRDLDGSVAATATAPTSPATRRSRPAEIDKTAPVISRGQPTPPRPTAGQPTYRSFTCADRRSNGHRRRPSPTDDPAAETTSAAATALHRPRRQHRQLRDLRRSDRQDRAGHHRRRPDDPPNSNGWYNTNVTNEFSLDAGISGPNAACALAFPGNAQSKTTSGEGFAVSVTSDPCTDLAGNTASGVPSAGFQIDKTAPVITDDGPTTLREQQRLVQHRRHQRVQPRRRDLRPQRGLCPGLPGQRPVPRRRAVRASRSA